ncbi:MAG: HD domain-containing protein [Candidatus Omnitrophica bacterium]|nr:HD domain-containing protein [Candidatus Omnitrophota bacterium]
MPEFIVKQSIKFKILGIVLFCLFLITTTLGFLLFEFSKKRTVIMLGTTIKGIAATIAGFIAPDDIALIQSDTERMKASPAFAASRHMGFAEQPSDRLDMPKPFSDAVKNIYARDAAILNSIKTVNAVDSPINIYVSSGNRLFMVLSTEPNFLTGISYLMRAEAKDAFRSGVAQATDIYKDKDGTWISAYAPGAYLATNGQRIIVEMNYKIDSYLRKLHEELAVIFVICIAGFLIAAVISYYLVTSLVSAVKKLDNAALGLEKGHYDNPIEIRTNDEIGHLAVTFELLRTSIRKKVDELRQSLAREKKAHLESLMALTNAIETRDPYTKEHVSRVQEYALLIAKALHLPHDEMIQLRYACILHDVGKIYIEDALLKKGKLTVEDFDEIKKHSERGAKIIEGIQFLSDVKDAVLYHQERYDGTGYPKGLKGNHIPLLARIVSVADAFDAMTTDRPYRSKMTFTKAIREIEEHSGTQFDPEIARAFLVYKDCIEEMAKKRFTDTAEAV